MRDASAQVELELVPTTEDEELEGDVNDRQVVVEEQGDLEMDDELQLEVNAAVAALKLPPALEEYSDSDSAFESVYE